MNDPREQVRRDAGPVEAALEYADGYFERGMAGKSIQAGDHFDSLATAVRLLRAELEQAEREREHYKAEAFVLVDYRDRIESDLREARARLASVPALVEALRQYVEYEGATPLAREALTVYEQSQRNG